MKKQHISRRNFLKTSALATVPLTLSGFPLYATAKSATANFLNGDNDKILVLVQLQGGNDGLATLFHADQYAHLNSVRNNILVPENTILNVSGAYGFHPSMQGLKDIWNMGNLGIVQNVGYPNANRSHFRSTDIWNSASNAEDFVSTGWIGRFYDLNYSNYPNGYPNVDCPHPFALTMGKIISETCQGINANYSLSLLDPFNPGTALVSAEGDIAANCYGDALTFVNDTVAQTNAFAQVISDAANMGNNLSTKWDSLSTELAQKLKNVARLIAGGLQTKIYIVQLGGFDTHDNQVVDGATETGLHSQLLQELSDAVCAFQDDLQLLNIDERVIGMTYSEFGRRIRSNAALGTDHGTAAPLFLFGSCIQNQILGEHPVIDPQVGIDDGVEMEYDFRDVYGTILNHWLGLTATEVMDIIHPNYQALPIFESDCIVPIALPIELSGFDAKAIDNQYVNLIWTTSSEYQNDYFEIEKSADGRDFERIKKVASKGNSDTLQTYQTKDEAPLIGRSYYRLRQVDLDGNWTHADIREVFIKPAPIELKIHPQPAKDIAKVTFYAPQSASARLRIVNAKGQIVDNFRIAIMEGENQIPLEVANLVTGQYWVHIEGQGIGVSAPLLVQ